MSAQPVDVLAVIDQAALHFGREREDAERLGQPGTATVYADAERELSEARAAVAELIAAAAEAYRFLPESVRWVAENRNGLNFAPALYLREDVTAATKLRAALARIGGGA